MMLKEVSGCYILMARWHSQSHSSRNSLPWQHLCQSALLPCKCHAMEEKELCSNEGTEGTCYELEEREERRSGQKEERKAVCLL